MSIDITRAVQNWLADPAISEDDKREILELSRARNDKELTDPHVKLEAGHAYRLRAEYRQRPEVSVVMPLHGRWEWAVRSLGALLANTEPTSACEKPKSSISTSMPGRFVCAALRRHARYFGLSRAATFTTVRS